jgi:hypothetical protein
MVVVVLGFLGLIVGIAATTFGPGNYVMGWQFVLPAHSDGIRLVAVATQSRPVRSAS